MLLPVNQPYRVALLGAALIVLNACSAQAWYRGFQTSAEINCRKQASPQDCASQTNSYRYDEYQKERERQKK